MNWQFILDLLKKFLPNIVTLGLLYVMKYINLEKKSQQLADFCIYFTKAVADKKVTQDEIKQLKALAEQLLKK